MPSIALLSMEGGDPDHLDYPGGDFHHHWRRDSCHRLLSCERNALFAAKLDQCVSWLGKLRSSNVLEWPTLKGMGMVYWCMLMYIVSCQHCNILYCMFSKIMFGFNHRFFTSSWGFPLFGWARLLPSNVLGGLAGQDQACRYRVTFVAGSLFVVRVCCLISSWETRNPMLWLEEPILI